MPPSASPVVRERGAPPPVARCVRYAGVVRAVARRTYLVEIDGKNLRVEVATAVVAEGLAPGDAVALLGEPLDERTVLGRVLARGDDAGALDRALAAAPAAARPNREAARYRAPVNSWLGCAVAGGIAAGALAWRPTLAIAAAAYALALRPRRRAEFLRRDRPMHRAPPAQAAVLVAGGVGLAIAALFGPIAWAIAAGALIVALAAVELRGADSLRRHRAIARAATVEGVVRDPTPVVVDGDEAALGVFADQYRADSTFLVETPAGSIEVDPDECVWASTVFERHWHGDDRHYSVSHFIPVGGRIAATGRLDGARLRPAGDAPVVLLATSSAGEPRALARMMVRQGVASALGLTVLAAALALVVVL